MKSLLALAFLLFALPTRAELVNIDSAELARLIAKGVPVIDIRTKPEWDETGIVPGSHPLTFFDEKGDADPAAWLARARSIAPPGTPVVLICRSGNRTEMAGRFLSDKAGYVKVYNVKDGIREWIKQGRPVAPAAPALAKCKSDSTC